LPDPNGHISARLRRLPGVTRAEANGTTGNLLILFDPRQTSALALLAELQAPGVVPPAVVPPSPPASRPARPGVYVTGARARLYQALGWASVGMAGVGAALPGIPTVPFVLLAGYFFVRSSPAAHAWLLDSRWFGPILRDWEERRAVRRSVKYTAVGLMAVGGVVTWLLGLPRPVVASILALDLVGLVVVLRLPEVAPSVPTSGAPA
jgi:uncharacterized membrane protein YbaN (DUF454 family)